MLIVGMYKIIFIIKNFKKLEYTITIVDLNKEINVYEYSDM